MKRRFIVLLVLTSFFLVTTTNAVFAGSGQVVYDSVNGVSTYSQKRIFVASSGWYAYNSSQASARIDKLGLSIASAYWRCPNGTPAGQVNSYNQYWYNTYGQDYQYGFVANSTNLCGAELKYAGGNHFYEYNGVIDYTWAEHLE